VTIYELEDALVEFVQANTSDFRFASNQNTSELSEPRVYSGFVPRDEVGAIIPGDISTYPAIIICAQSGEMDIYQDNTAVNILVGCFDANRDQQGYRDCVNVVQRLKDRFREIDIIRERFTWTPPLNWMINRHLGSEGMNAFPYYFADMTVHFLLPVMTTQYDVTVGDGDVTPGRYNSVPIPTPAPNEHWKHEVPPTIEWDEHYVFQKIPPPVGPCVITPNTSSKPIPPEGFISK
jgi:hypothetical protein